MKLNLHAYWNNRARIQKREFIMLGFVTNEIYHSTQELLKGKPDGDYIISYNGKDAMYCNSKELKIMFNRN